MHVFGLCYSAEYVWTNQSPPLWCSVLDCIVWLYFEPVKII